MPNPTLLHLDSSPCGERSYSRQLTAHFVRHWLAARPGGAVVHRDLGLHPAPLVSGDWIDAVFTPPGARSPAQREAIAISDALIDELFAAHEIVIGAPMYNFNVSAALKAWIDQVVRVGRTIAPGTYEGLLAGRRATVLSTRGWPSLGSGEEREAWDAQAPYLRQILGFLGFADIEIIRAGHLTGSDDERRRALDAACIAAARRAAQP